jgi:alpha-L-fucosidase
MKPNLSGLPFNLLLATLALHAPAAAAPAPTPEDRRTIEDTRMHPPAPPDGSLSTEPIAAGPFTPNYASLKTYRCPDWYQDAKLGMWAHWGPQGVAEIGDWYARDMYIEGSGTYKYHVAHYGPPSVFGYKDIIGLWKAENFDPDRLIRLYQQAGAKYFVSMACHHDNFDLWNSRYHRWNAVNMGPHKDVVGLWRDAALRQGLRFGVSEHMAPSYKWFSVAHNADKEGAMAGVPYDGNDPHYYDLYGPKPEKIWGSGAELWQETDVPDWWKLEWFHRVRDVMDNYQPDYVYSDFGNVPFRHEVGWKLLANYYNKSIADHGGKLEAVYTGKGDFERTYVRDFESGAAGDVQPEPWQMDWCINSFFYFKDTNERPYRQADAVIRLLLDVVSKNGNLLLSIPQKPDGTIDGEEEKILSDMAGWMQVNGEAVFGTRPFQTYGEGPTVIRDFRVKTLPYTPQDIRFTVKGDVLYAAALGVPPTALTIKALRQDSPYAQGEVSGVELLGSPDKLVWSRNNDGLTINLPANAPNAIALVFKIEGLHGLAWHGVAAIQPKS